MLAKRIERDTRDELYVSLLGKSQTFHNRQRVGDLMARGANDVRQLGTMFSPGIDLLVDSLSQGIVPIIFIASSSRGCWPRRWSSRSRSSGPSAGSARQLSPVSARMRRTSAP